MRSVGAAENRIEHSIRSGTAGPETDWLSGRPVPLRLVASQMASLGNTSVIRGNNLYDSLITCQAQPLQPFGTTEAAKSAPFPNTHGMMRLAKSYGRVIQSDPTG